MTSLFEKLAKKHGTPLYVYDAEIIRARAKAFRKAMGPKALICYSVKSNGNMSVLRLMRSLGLGVDVVSGGELARARKAGFSPRKVVFAGVGKTESEIEQALRWGIHALTVESWQELTAIGKVAVKIGRPAWVYLRVNPDIHARSHKKTATGLAETKFGIPAREMTPQAIARAGGPGVLMRGLHVHLGSPVKNPRLYGKAADLLLNVIERLASVYPEMTDVDLGGGYALGVAPAKYAACIHRVLKGTGYNLTIEPGRSIVAEAGILLARVLYLKKAGRKQMAILDTGMNDLIRPAFYDAVHPVARIGKRSGKESRMTLVGPICETGDVLARDIMLPGLKQNDLIAIGCAGAYGFSMASQYNGRPRAAEVIVDRGRGRLVRKREIVSDLWRGEL